MIHEITSIMVIFLLRKIFLGNLNEAISLVKIDVTFTMVSISANKIASFTFKICHKRKVTDQKHPWIAYNSQKPMSVKLGSSLINPDEYPLLLNGFHPLLLSGISLIIIFEIRNRLVLF